MRRPVLALLTDFGTRDPYVGAMKGAALAVHPELTIVDVGHEVPPHDVLTGALHLEAVHSVFPPGTAFVAVVDPGVGTARRAIAAEAGGRHFVGPDNGIFTAVFREAPPTRIVSLTNPRFHRQVVSRTFEGRDRFAPVAAWLLSGVDLDECGPRVTDPHLLPWPEPIDHGDRLEGRVLASDRFGNLMSNLSRSRIDAFAAGRPFAVVAGGETRRFVSTYSEIGPGEVCALYGSTERLELAAQAAPAADRLGVEGGVWIVRAG